MRTNIRKWGNSQGLRLSKELLHLAGIGLDDQLEVTVSSGQILLTKVPAPKFDLEDLLARIPADYHAEEVDWGGPLGNEAW